MKKLLILLLLPSLAWGSDLGQDYARMNPYILGGGVSAAACNPTSNEIGNRSDLTGTSSIGADDMVCILYEADCTGTLGVAYAKHAGTDPNNAKICVYDSVYQTDLTSEHNPDNSDTLLSGSSCVSTSSSAAEWANSGASKVGGSVTSGTKYLVCIVADPATLWDYYRDATAGNYAYLNSSSSYASPPETLTGSWTGYTPRSISAYVTIE